MRATWMPGTVTDVNGDDGGQIHVETGVQDAWYGEEEVKPFPSKKNIF